MSILYDLADKSSDTEDDFDYVPPTELSGILDCDRLSSDEDFEEGAKVRGKARKVCKVEKKETKAKANVAVNEKQTADDVYKCFLEEVEKEEPGIRSGENLDRSDCNELKENSNISLVVSSQSSSKKNSESLHELAGEVVFSSDGCMKPRANTSIEFPSFPIAKEKVSSPKKVVPSKIPNVKKKGVDSALNTIMIKKKKITILEKSHNDWNLFKEQEGIEQELEKFNKGKFGYLERQRFLERSDFRSFEIEKAMRSSRVKK